MHLPALCLNEMVELASGSFLMGENPNDKFANATERPSHMVSFRHRFAIARKPMTNGLYRQFRPDHAAGESDALPTVNVTWDDAIEFCEWINAQSHDQSGAESAPLFRLPSEAEWEYACRAGSQEPFSTGSDLTLEQANFLYSEEGLRIGLGFRTIPGSYPANAAGIYDMHGNVCEWVVDAWRPDYAGAPNDGSAWLDGSENRLRVIRGGAWDYLPRLLRSSWRDSLPKNQSRDNIGFRLAATLS